MPFTYKNMLDETATILAPYCGFWNSFRNMLFCRNNNPRIAAVAALITKIRNGQTTALSVLISLTNIAGDDTDATGDGLRQIIISVCNAMHARLITRDDNVLINTLNDKILLLGLFQIMPVLLTPDEHRDVLIFLSGHVFHNKNVFLSQRDHCEQIKNLVHHLQNESTELRTEVLSNINPFQILIKFPSQLNLIISSIMDLNTEQKLCVIGVNDGTYYERFIPIVSIAPRDTDLFVQLIGSLEKEQRGKIFQTRADGTNLLTAIIYHQHTNLTSILPLIEELPEKDILSLCTNFNDPNLLASLMTDSMEASFSALLSFLIRNLRFEQIQSIYRQGLESAIKQNKHRYFHMMIEKLSCFSSEQKFRILSESDDGINSLIHPVLTAFHDKYAEIRFFIHQLHSLDEQHKIQLLELTDLNGNNAISFIIIDEPGDIIEYFDEMIELFESITDDAAKTTLLAHLNRQNRNALMHGNYDLQCLIDCLTTFNLSETQLFEIIGQIDYLKQNLLIINAISKIHSGIFAALDAIASFKNEELKSNILGQVDNEGNNALYYALHPTFGQTLTLRLLKAILNLNDASATSIIEHTNSNGKNGFDMILTMKTNEKATHLDLLKSLFFRFKTSQILKWLDISKDSITETQTSSKRIAPYLIRPLLEWATHLCPVAQYNMMRFLEREESSCSQKKRAAITTAKNALIEHFLTKKPSVMSLSSSSLFQSHLNPRKEEIIRSYFAILTGEKNMRIIKTSFNKINVIISKISLIHLSTVMEAILAANLQGVCLKSKSGTENQTQLSVINVGINELLENYRSLINASEQSTTSQAVLSHA